MADQLTTAAEHVLDTFDEQLASLGEMPKAEEALISLVMGKLIERVATATENADWTPGQRGAALQLMGKVMAEDKNCDAVVLVRILADGRIATGGASRKMRDGALAEMGQVCRIALTEMMRLQHATCKCPRCTAQREASFSVFNGPKAEA
jgi:hypothetical protein